MSTADIGRLVVLAAIWGASFLFLRVGAPEFGAFLTSFLRVGIAGLALALWFRLSGQSMQWRAHRRAYLVIGAINGALPFTFYAFAALHIDSGLSAILNAAAPLFGVVFGALWLGERITAQRALGLALGIAGVALVARGGTGGDGPLFGWAVAACLGATVCYALTGVYLKRFAQGLPARGIAAGSQLAAAAMLAPFALANLPGALPSLTASASILMLSLLCSAVAFLLYFRLITDLGPARALTVTFLIPAFGVLWGALLLGEALGPASLAGGVLVVLGTVFVLKGV